jgi:hypothetical protein
MGKKSPKLKCMQTKCVAKSLFMVQKHDLSEKKILAVTRRCKTKFVLSPAKS